MNAVVAAEVVKSDTKWLRMVWMDTEIAVVKVAEVEVDGC
jgi:hypothetical protein